MKLKLRLLYKLALIILLFSYGLIIAGGVFPLLKVFCPASKGRNKRDEIKTRWLKLLALL